MYFICSRSCMMSALRTADCWSCLATMVAKNCIRTSALPMKLGGTHRLESAACSRFPLSGAICGSLDDGAPIKNRFPGNDRGPVPSGLQISRLSKRRQSVGCAPCGTPWCVLSGYQPGITSFWTRASALRTAVSRRASPASSCHSMRSAHRAFTGSSACTMA